MRFRTPITTQSVVVMVLDLAFCTKDLDYLDGVGDVTNRFIFSRPFSVVGIQSSPARASLGHNIRERSAHVFLFNEFLHGKEESCAHNRMGIRRQKFC